MAYCTRVRYGTYSTSCVIKKRNTVCSTGSTGYRILVEPAYVRYRRTVRRYVPYSHRYRALCEMLNVLDNHLEIAQIDTLRDDLMAAFSLADKIEHMLPSKPSPLLYTFVQGREMPCFLSRSDQLTFETEDLRETFFAKSTRLRNDICMDEDASTPIAVVEAYEKHALEQVTRVYLLLLNSLKQRL